MRCPNCESLQTIRKGKRSGKTITKQHQKGFCKECRQYFTYGKIFKQRVSVTEKQALARFHLENRSSYRILERQSGHDKQMINQWTLQIASQAKDDLWIAKRFHPTWSGILIPDGTWVSTYDWTAQEPLVFGYQKQDLRRIHNQTLLWGADFGTGDLPAHLLADSEGKVDCVLYFERLKAINYPLRAIVSDGNRNLLSAAELVYGKPIIWQQCTRHFAESLRQLAREEEPKYEMQTKTLCNQLCFVIKQKTQKAFYAALVIFTDEKHRFRTDKQIVMIKHFWANLGSLIQHLEHPGLGLPMTNNMIENYNRQLKLRLNSLGQFRTHQNATNYLKLWNLYRRFTPFTDCKKQNKHRNGRSPLQLAGVNTYKIDYLKL